MLDIDALIERWRSGDENAAEAIYTQSRGITFGLAYALLDDAADAEEVTQDVLAYALSHIDRYDPQRARFSTWLYTITISPPPCSFKTVTPILWCRKKKRQTFSKPPANPSSSNGTPPITNSTTNLNGIALNG